MINYPNKKKVDQKKEVINAANRGMDFEHAINISSSFYDEEGRAIITKRPTPIHIVKVDYTKMRIVDAYFEKQSTTDYNGVYRSRYIDFECKETKSTTSFTFRNIYLHQIKHLQKVLKHGGIAFFLIYFKSLDEIYLVDANIIISLFLSSEKHSISIKELREKGYLVSQGYNPRVNYLDVVDEVYFHEKNL